MRVFPLVSCPRVVQIVSFALAALYSGLWWWRWFRSGAESKMWPQLGLFSGVMCVGSIVGTVAWASNMVSFALYFEYRATNVNSQENQENCVIQEMARRLLLNLQRGIPLRHRAQAHSAGQPRAQCLLKFGVAGARNVRGQAQVARAHSADYVQGDGRCCCHL